ncbi:DUF6939 family protein [Porphyromonas endodontalis]
MIYVANKKRKLEKIQEEFPKAVILDVTSTSESRSARLLSPFYPHMNIPIPFTEGVKATCVEAVWQGLKVFETADVDLSAFKNNTMKEMKRTARKYGLPQGHRKGVYGTDLLNYFEARMQIYLPTYKWVLDNIPEVHHVVERIKAQSEKQDIVLLDYNTNIDFRDISKPLSHAGLVKLYIEGHYPESVEGYTPMTEEELLEKKDKEKTAKAALRKKKRQKLQLDNQDLFNSKQ